LTQGKQRVARPPADTKNRSTTGFQSHIARSAELVRGVSQQVVKSDTAFAAHAFHFLHHARDASICRLGRKLELLGCKAITYGGQFFGVGA
jgi:hypothetical protein